MTPTILSALSALPRDASDEERADAVAEALGLTWQPIETAPKKGEFLAWNEGFREVVQVWLFAPGVVINASKGRTFHTRWWMPLPSAPLAILPPPPAAGDAK